MTRLKVFKLLGIWYAILSIQGSTGTVLSPDPSLSEIFFSARPQDAKNQSAASTTITPTISERIHASLNNVLRIPLPLWGTVVVPGTGTPTPSQAQQPQKQQQLSPAPQVTGAGNQTPEKQREQPENPGIQQQQKQPQQIGVFRKPVEAHGAPPPSSFLPISDVNQAIQSTIAQLSTLSHWPFGYATTSKPQQQTKPVPTTIPPKKTPTQVSTQKATTTTKVPPTTKPPPPPSTTTTTQRTTTTASTMKPTVVARSTTVPAAPPTLPPVGPTQAMTPSSQSPYLPSFIASNGGSIFNRLPAASQIPARPSLPERLHNRIHSTLNYIRPPTLSEIGANRPRPMLTEPSWVTDILGTTLEPPTTRAPTLSERVQNSLQNVLLFVPATLLNFWYENWGTQQVNRFVNRLQSSTPQPGSSVSPIFATSEYGPNPFLNFSMGGLGVGIDKTPLDLPAIAAFINTNGTLMPTIVHPVVNKTANTIEYQLRGVNETTVLWAGSLSNDVFFGNKKSGFEVELMDIEEDEDQKKKNFEVRIRRK